MVSYLFSPRQLNRMLPAVPLERYTPGLLCCNLNKIKETFLFFMKKKIFFVKTFSSFFILPTYAGSSSNNSNLCTIFPLSSPLYCNGTKWWCMSTLHFGCAVPWLWCTCWLKAPDFAATTVCLCRTAVDCWQWLYNQHSAHMTNDFAAGLELLTFKLIRQVYVNLMHTNNCLPPDPALLHVSILNNAG